MKNYSEMRHQNIVGLLKIVAIQEDGWCTKREAARKS